MTTLQLLIVCVTVLAALLIHAERRAPSTAASVGEDLALEADITAHLSTGATVRGRLVQRGDVLRLADAHFIADGKASPLGGVAVIPAAQVDWAQDLGA